MSLVPSTIEDYAHLLAQAGSELEDQLVRELCQDSLHEFVKEFWSVVEPGRPFVDNWHLRWMCSELQAISAGETTHLLMNVPPGAMKSLLLVFWTAWEWGPKNMPTLRYLCASYTQTLTIRDNRRRKAILNDEKYRRLWPHVKIDQNRTSDENFGNTSTGWCIATSTGGVGTGERADRVICFPEDEVVHTEQGPMKIGDIVRERRDVKVWSTNVDTGETTLKSVTGWHTNPGSKIVEVGMSDGSTVRCTPDHKIWTRSGWVEAGRLRASDMIPGAPCFDVPGCSVGNTIDSPQGFTGKRRFVDRFYGIFSKLGVAVDSAFSIVKFKNFMCGFAPSASVTYGGYSGGTYAEDGAKLNSSAAALCDFYRGISGEFVVPASNSRNMFCSFTPGSTGSNGVYNSLAYVESDRSGPGGAVACSYFKNLLGRKFRLRLGLSEWKRTVLFRIVDVLGSCAPGEIIKHEISRISVQMANFASRWFWPNEQLCYQNDFSVNRGVKMGVAFFRGRSFENFLLYPHRGGSAGATAPVRDSGVAFCSSHIADAIKPFEPRDRTPLFVREVGYAHETYCLSVQGNHTFYVSGRQEDFGILVSNCDDAHSVNTAESDAVRAQTLHWWREVVPTRVNDPQKSAFIVVMQRVHADDVAGDILDNRGDEWVHVMIPMRYEPDRHCRTAHGEDPRGLDEQGNLLPGMSEPGVVDPDSPLARQAGKLYWPERFPEWTVVRDSIPLGRFGVAAQFQQLPSPRGGGIVLDIWWQIWPPAGEFDKWVKPTLIEDGRVVKLMSFPPSEFTIAYLDTAFTEKDTNAYCAMICLDVFADPEGHPKVMLRNAWQAHPTLKQLAAKVLEICRRHRVDCLVIENKAGANWVKQELMLLMRRGEFSIVLDEPRSDKVARLHSVSVLFEDSMVYAPNRDWADMVIKQTSEFPKGKYKDLVDCLSGGLGYLRRNDLIKLAVEHDEDEREKKTFRGNQGGVASLYEVN